MEGMTVNSVIYDVDIWCDCGCKFNMAGEDIDGKCPKCGAKYGMLPVRVDGE